MTEPHTHGGTDAPECTTCKPACVFCDIDKNVPTASLYYSTPTIYRFEPLNPVTPGHMLFVPHTHIEHAGERPGLAGHVFAAAASWANHKDVPYNLITSSGKEATQSVFHLHVHYVPRRDGDGLHLPWTGQQMKHYRLFGLMPRSNGWATMCGVQSNVTDVRKEVTCPACLLRVIEVKERD